MPYICKQACAVRTVGVASCGKQGSDQGPVCICCTDIGCSVSRALAGVTVAGPTAAPLLLPQPAPATGRLAAPPPGPLGKASPMGPQNFLTYPVKYAPGVCGFSSWPSSAGLCESVKQ